MMLGLNICTCFAIFCYSSLARKVPTNYILLSIFTLSESYIVSAFASQYSPDTVLAAALLTLSITLALTFYATTTKSDFTMMGGALFIISMAFIMMGLLMWMLGGREKGSMWNIVYCTLGVILYGFYLIYDV